MVLTPSFFLLLSCNAVLMAVLVFGFFRLKKMERRFAENRNYLETLADMKEAIDLSIRQGMRVVEEITLNLEPPEMERSPRSKSERDSSTPLPPPSKKKFSLFSQSSDKYEEVLRLASNGLSSREIAKQINLPLGEIELALTLRK
ncbi:MAG: hypothetical protein COV67_03505 [Nitrospinae bacterium CG11_big_fil_rev_8_21_14_0_20_56_8]|nr:MAG: hypothetical protein COV67_03505 [Nitrospinae bacterium CG11_big_fil_rev_8_21_14_0_20_56_8]